MDLNAHFWDDLTRCVNDVLRIHTIIEQNIENTKWLAKVFECRDLLRRDRDL